MASGRYGLAGEVVSEAIRLLGEAEVRQLLEARRLRESA
jgi:hypothetical protein